MRKRCWISTGGLVLLLGTLGSWPSEAWTERQEAAPTVEAVEAAVDAAEPTETQAANPKTELLLNWHRLAEGVYAATQPHDTRFDDTNSLVVLGEDGVLVVDAQASRATVLGLIDRVAELTDLPIRWVVNTHWHGDHVQGNAVYREAVGEGVIFVGHHTLTEDIPARAELAVSERIARLEEVLPVAEAQLAKGLSRGGEPLDAEGQAAQRSSIERAKEWLAANREVVFLAPDLTYSDRLTLHLGRSPESGAAQEQPSNSSNSSVLSKSSKTGGRRVELFHFTGHTRGDTVVYLPDDQILAAGDLVDAAPFGGHGFPSRWVETLDQLLDLDVEVIVPGHGAVLQGEERGRQHLGSMRAYFSELVRQVRQLREVQEEGAEEESAEVIAAQLDLSEVENDLSRGDEGVVAFLRGTLVQTVERVLAEHSD